MGVFFFMAIHSLTNHEVWDLLLSRMSEVGPTNERWDCKKIGLNKEEEDHLECETWDVI